MRMGKHRSPNYPALALGEAVQKAGVLFDKEKRTTLEPFVAVQALGYKGLNGPARTTLSALKKYGLVEEHGKGVRVSDLAIKALHPADEREYVDAMREAAQRVDLFREIYTTMPEGSDNAIASMLIKRGFSAPAAQQAIGAYRDTMALAKLQASGYTSPQEQEDREAMDDKGRAAFNPGAGGGGAKPNAYSWALSQATSAELRLSGARLTKAEAERLRQYLDLTIGAITDDTT
jgi:hypothetical protein